MSLRTRSVDLRSLRVDTRRIRIVLAGVIALLVVAIALILANRAKPDPDVWDTRATGTTAVHYKDGVTCFYYEPWHTMSCVYNNATYGPSEH